MECNRDEAVRAKQIAEKKLSDKDFAGAKKFTLKAQALFPGLEGISQMLTTLNVYISAENKVSGEVDWYGILGVNPSDDDETIRKQYRKLALVLHPDKNKSVGADGAFKLLSEAWSLLSDKAKRLAYNQKRSYRGGVQQKAPSQSGGPSAAAPGVNGVHSFANRETSKPKSRRGSTATQMGPTLVPPPVPPRAPPPTNTRSDTFWTICHRCRMHYEYLKIYLNHTLLCPNCREPFPAKEMAPPDKFSKPAQASTRHHHQNSSIPPSSKPYSNLYNHGKSAAPTHNSGGVPSTFGSSNKTNINWAQINVPSTTEPSIASKAANVVKQVNDRLKREREEFYSGYPSKYRKTDDDGQASGVKIPFQMSTGNGGAANSGNASGLRKTSFEEAYGFSSTNIKFNSTRELTPLETRNMLMHKAQTEMRIKISEWETEQKKLEEKKADPKNSFSKNQSIKVNGDQTAEQQEQEREALAMNVPDPDFHDFDLDRTEHSFEDNQVWAAYDDDDGMPRFYALIHKVLSRDPLKMKISWLNSKTTTEFGSMDWIGSGFRKTCGEFRVGRHEIYKSLNSFSQNVEWIKGPRGTILIFPKKGEVWALYRNWSSDWNEHIPDDVIHKYDMVQVLDDFNEEEGVSVSPLVKFTGFKTVFHPYTEQSEVKKIPKEEMFRFSHQVPKYLLTGEEAHNAPKGCLELDPAATPLELIQQQETADANGGQHREHDAVKSKEEKKVENSEEVKIWTD